MPAPQDPFQAEPDGRCRLAQWRLVKGSLMAGVAVFLLGLILAGVVQGDGGMVFGILGFVFGLTAFIIAGAFYFYAVRWQRAVDAMVAGDRFAHWVYSDEQWEAHLEGEKKRRGRLWLVLGGIMSASGLLICIFASFDEEMSAKVKAIIWVALFGGMTVLGVAIGWAIEFFNRRHAEWMRTRGGEVFIGPTGVYISGTYWPWKAYGQRLTDVRYLKSSQPEAAPHASKEAAQLVFSFIINTGKGNTFDREVFIPVPYGQEDEAQTVLALVRDR